MNSRIRLSILILVTSISLVLVACAGQVISQDGRAAGGSSPTPGVLATPVPSTPTATSASSSTRAATTTQTSEAPGAPSLQDFSPTPLPAPTAPTKTSAPTPSATPTVTNTPTPEPAQVVLISNANLRSWPSMVYPVIGGGQAGQTLPVLGQALGWWQTPAGWIFGELVRANAAAQAAPTVRELPPTPTAEVKAQVEAKPSSASASASASTSTLPAWQDVVVLGPDTQYPVRARVVKGWGYELVDASTQYDWLIRRDVFGQVAHAYWGDKGLYGQHPQGIRITLLDYLPKPGCQRYCAGQAPIALDNRGPSDYSLREGFGDGSGSMIGIACASKTVQYDPQECFIAVGAAGPYLTDIVVGSTIVAHNQVLTTVERSTPIFTDAPFTPLLGQAHREGDQWRWADPFLVVVPAQ